MAFPGPYATVYRNEAGEVLGWSDESSYEPDYDEMEREYERNHCPDCGNRNDQCVCHLYCSDCGELTIQDHVDDSSPYNQGDCTNPECPSNA